MELKKAKLPRKRKKRAIKAQGRVWYINNIKLHRITQKCSPEICEKICKFWVNAQSHVGITTDSKGNAQQSYMPQAYW